MSELDCPRCGAPLQWRGPTLQWRKHYECDECWLAFELVRENRFEPSSNPPGKFLHHTVTLQPGRSPHVKSIRYMLLNRFEVGR
jgi:hypothetical protein